MSRAIELLEKVLGSDYEKKLNEWDRGDTIATVVGGLPGLAARRGYKKFKSWRAKKKAAMANKK
jgi:hypothetical protein